MCVCVCSREMACHPLLSAMVVCVCHPAGKTVTAWISANDILPILPALKWRAVLLAAYNDASSVSVV